MKAIIKLVIFQLINIYLIYQVVDALLVDGSIIGWKSREFSFSNDPVLFLVTLAIYLVFIVVLSYSAVFDFKRLKERRI